MRTISKPHRYICELHGVCFVTFVSEKNKAFSCIFPSTKWLAVVEELANEPLELIEPFA